MFQSGEEKVTEHVYRYTVGRVGKIRSVVCCSGYFAWANNTTGPLTQKNRRVFLPPLARRSSPRRYESTIHETSDDDFATKRGREGEEAETSTQVYKAVSSVSLSRLSRNENVRPARILIPRTEPPPGWCGPRATPFFFASPMSPRCCCF